MYAGEILRIYTGCILNFKCIKCICTVRMLLRCVPVCTVCVSLQVGTLLGAL